MLNPILKKDDKGIWWVYWTRDPNAIAYQITTPTGVAQAGKNQLSSKVGRYDSLPRVTVAAGWPQTPEVATDGTAPPPPPPPPPQPAEAWPVRPLLEPDVFASATGSDNAIGTKLAPMSKKSAFNKATGGAAECIGLLPDGGPYMQSSDFYPQNKTGHFIQVRSYGSRAVIKGSGGSGNYNGFQVPADHGFFDFRNIDFDGSLDKRFAQGIHVNGGHHVNAVGCRSVQTGAAGIMIFTHGADYVWAVGCKSWRYGDGAGWSSAVSYNNSGKGNWFDTAPGFHNGIIGCVFTGGIDMSLNDAGQPNISDGNGIILDLYGPGSPVLIAGNIDYMIGGKGILVGAGQGVITNAKVYVVNNTGFKNGLDLRKPDNWGEFCTNGADGTVFANNIAVPRVGGYAYRMMNSNNIKGYKNAMFGGKLQGFNPQFTADPKFLWVPSVSDNVDGQWRNPPKPWELPANAFMLGSDSPYRTDGDDVTLLPGLDSVMQQQMADWAGVDMYGKSRLGSMVSLGALQA